MKYKNNVVFLSLLFISCAMPDICAMEEGQPDCDLDDLAMQLAACRVKPSLKARGRGAKTAKYKRPHMFGKEPALKTLLIKQKEEKTLEMMRKQHIELNPELANMKTVIPRTQEGQLCVDGLNLSYQGNLTYKARKLTGCLYLNYLDLSGNRLATIPEQVFLLTFLEKLNVSNNNMKEFPDLFASLEKLSHFDMSHNPVEKFPKSLEELVQDGKLKIITVYRDGKYTNIIDDSKKTTLDNQDDFDSVNTLAERIGEIGI